MARILLVEDDEMLRDMIQMTLELYHHVILNAASGVEAIEKAGAERPDLILMDKELPIMDGYEATQRLKAAPATRAIPIIFLTASAGQEYRRLALEAGANEYETKPIDFNRLMTKMAALMGA